jgi:hypothetical protein
MDAQPQHWWQWLLQYSALPIALLTTISGIVGALLASGFTWPVAYDKGAKRAEVEQLDAWGRNHDCLGAEHNVKLSSQTAYAIDLQACPSGDLLIQLTPLHNPDQKVFRWIITKDLFKPPAQFALSSAAWAQGAPAAKSTTVLDIKKSGSTITRRVQLSDSSCVDEKIDGLTGRLVGQTKAPCTKF